MRWADSNEVINGASITVGASATKTPVSNEFAITNPTRLLAYITASGVTVTTAISAILQTKSGSASWQDSKPVSITTNGTFTIKLLDTIAGDQTYLPLGQRCRLVITTGTGDAVTVDAVTITRDL